MSNDEAPGGSEFIDLGEQPADLGFVLDELLGPESRLEAPVDPELIGAGGLSLGGATVYGLVYDDCCRDDRVAAAMVLDGDPEDALARIDAVVAKAGPLATWESRID